MRRCLLRVGRQELRGYFHEEQLDLGTDAVAKPAYLHGRPHSIQCCPDRGAARGGDPRVSADNPAGFPGGIGLADCVEPDEGVPSSTGIVDGHLSRGRAALHNTLSRRRDNVSRGSRQRTQRICSRIEPGASADERTDCGRATLQCTRGRLAAVNVLAAGRDTILRHALSADRFHSAAGLVRY